MATEIPTVNLESQGSEDKGKCPRERGVETRSIVEQSSDEGPILAGYRSCQLRTNAPQVR